MNTPTAIPPLVLLHGFTGGPESWRSVVSHLEPPYSAASILAPYLAGHGEYPEALNLDPNTHTFEAEVARLANVCRTDLFPSKGSESKTPAVLVGYSLGARIGLGLLLKYPALFRAAVLIGVNPGLTSGALRAARKLDDEALAQRAENTGLDAFLAHWERLPLFASQKQLTPAVLVEQATIRRRNTASGLASSLRTCGLAQMPDYWEHLASLSHPIRLVVGQHDQRFVEIAQHMSAILPNAAVELVPGCGHNVPLEAPAALAALIQASL